MLFYNYYIMNKKRGVVILRIIILLMLLIIPFVSASFFDFPNIKEVNLNIKNWITGKATSATTTLNITIGNTAPIVNNITPISAQSVTAGSITNVTFTFVATDADGVSNIDNTTASGRFNISAGDDKRFNSSCKVLPTVISTTQANFSCTIALWYWDPSGQWTVNASIKDTPGAYAQNYSTNFSLGSTTAMNMTPTALTWSSVGPLSTNTLANQNITIFNIANKNITANNVNVTAISMQGETTTTEHLNASNFTVSIANACDTGATMVNATTISITPSNITAGNFTASSVPQEELFFCLEEVTAGISQQSYSTTGAGAWTVGII